MSSLHPALAFLQEKVPAAQALSADTLLLNIDGARVEIAVAPPNGSPAFFAAGQTRLSYRCSSALSDPAREGLRAALLELRDRLAASYVVDPSAPLPAGGGWTDRLQGEDLSAWREWVTQRYRASIEADRRDTCHGLPDCLDLRMRPPIQSPWVTLAEAPRSGPCSRCARARGCRAAHVSADGAGGLKPLRHIDAGSAELAALRVLADAAAVPLTDALDAYSGLQTACADRALDGALALEYSVRLPAGERRPDRLRFVSYYPMVTSDAVRREINRGRRDAARQLAGRWLTPAETRVMEAWLECAARTQPASLGLSIGLELDSSGVRLQIYAHPSPSDQTDAFVAAAVRAIGGSPEDVPAAAVPPVLVGIALCAHHPPALKLYYPRTWEARGDTGLLPDGLGALAPFNPGWGLAIQEHLGGRAAWIKWDFPVNVHYQAYERFLDAFWRVTGGDGSTPAWLSGESFSPWPTWASLGRGGWALYFQAR